MELNLTDGQQKIIDLLQKTGALEAAYPIDLLEKRRKTFLSLVAGLSAGAFAQEGLTRGWKNIKLPAKDVLIQIMLGTALVVEIGVSAYVFRDKVKGFFRKDTPTPAIIAPVRIDTATPAFVELIEVPTETPVPTITEADTIPQATLELDSISTEPASPTEIPNGTPGRHLGQTPGPPGQPTQEPTPQ